MFIIILNYDVHLTIYKIRDIYIQIRDNSTLARFCCALRTYPPYSGFGCALLGIDIVVKGELLTSGRFYEFHDESKLQTSNAPYIPKSSVSLTI